MKFSSQICTTREQSERLIALGLKKETADCHWSNVLTIFNREWLLAPIPIQAYTETEIPAWSLHRLIEMIGEEIQTDWQAMCLQDKGFTKRDDLYDNIVDCIEWLIKEGYFPKEYLV